MQKYALCYPIAADCLPGVLQRSDAIADRQRRCRTRRKTTQSDFRPRFSRGTARSSVDLLHDLEFCSEFPRTRQRGDTVRVKGDEEPPGAERAKGPGEQPADHVHVFARGRADAPPDFDYRLSRGGACQEPGRCDAAVHYHVIHWHGCGARNCWYWRADTFVS